MDEIGISYFIFDKAIKDNHGYVNAETKLYTIDYLAQSNKQFTLGIDEHWLGLEKFPHDLDESLFKFIKFTINEDIKIYIIGIIDEKFELIFDRYRDFVILLFKFHLKYDCENDIVLDDIINKIKDTSSDFVDPIIREPEYCNYKMYEFQKKSIKWMIDIELRQSKVKYRRNREIFIKNYIVYVDKNTYEKVDKKRVITFNGGGLIDEVGLGKTYQMIVLSLHNRRKNIDIFKKKYGMLCSKATLIICPNHLCIQWFDEINKMINMKIRNVKIIKLFSKLQHKKYTYDEILNADFIITSFNFLTNPSHDEATHIKSSRIKNLFSYTDINIIIKECSNNLLNDVNVYKKTNVNLFAINWQRIIVDEFHELSTPSYNHIPKILLLMSSRNRWCVTGTPFDKGVSILNLMLEFVTKVEFSNIVISSGEINEHIQNNFFRRNTRKSVINEYKLLPLKESIIWLNFSRIEERIYQAYTRNNFVDKFDIKLRQICCHPELVDGVNDGDINTSLDVLEHKFQKLYKNEYIEILIKYDLLLQRYGQNKLKLTCAEMKLVGSYLKHDFEIIYNFPTEVDNEKDNTKRYLINDNIIKSFNSNRQYIKVNNNELNEEMNDRTNKKERLIICYDNYNDLINRIKNIEKNGTIRNLEINIKELSDNIKTTEQKLIGKKNTYEYYYNVIDRVHNTMKNQGDETCVICLGNILHNDVGLTKCWHLYCYECIRYYITSGNNKCPLCKTELTMNDVYKIDYHTNQKEENKINNKQQLINKIGTKLAHLIMFLKYTDKHVILFSQWDKLLHNIGNILLEYNINNVFCSGSVWQKGRTINKFNSDNDVKIIMLSSDGCVSGTNLTKAEIVILLDPVYGTYEHRKNIEMQAIGRAYRMGQTKQVEIVRFIIHDSVEEEIYNINKEEDKNINDSIKKFEMDENMLQL